MGSSARCLQQTLDNVFPHHLIQFITSWWWVDSSSPLFTLMSKTVVIHWTVGCLKMVSIMDEQWLKTNSRIMLGFRSERLFLWVRSTSRFHRDYLGVKSIRWTMESPLEASSSTRTPEKPVALNYHSLHKYKQLKPLPLSKMKENCALKCNIQTQSLEATENQLQHNATHPVHHQGGKSLNPFKGDWFQTLTISIQNLVTSHISSGLARPTFSTATQLIASDADSSSFRWWVHRMDVILKQNISDLMSGCVLWVRKLKIKR